ncbi:PA2169 family four-helix-bundle protein [Chryseobacterium formosus]|uniref:PA2169 family four-helix-bundle protein n=1 Tax=Chryseobacterium formosus TaxID=1537363 RepID=A0ABT3XW11_9FLAO|nr:PA2169 family four-helix-bundle protein [Chryseobacterium formosus]MCX8525866.1 PA2169 family four-helix-bundle protein [Chryseobacterium formosus]
MENTKTVATLNDLLNITNDRIKGFTKVEDKVWDSYSALKVDYDQMVRQSKVMRADLIDLINERGGEVNDSSTVAGALHRGWIDVKNAFSGNNAESTIENVIFGEKAAIDSYQEALQSGNLCPQSTVVVADQHMQLQESYRKFENIEKSVD